MTDIRDYIILSKTASSINDLFSTPADFKRYYENISRNETKSLVRHFVVNNIPFAFKERPILYEQVTQYIADKLEIDPGEVKLIGSAKTGFSICPLPNYGKPFSQHSDLDFSIINEDLFSALGNEFNTWSQQFELMQIKPSNSREEFYWDQNLTNVPRQINRGFIDTHFIPNREQFKTTRRINNSLWLVQKYLNEKHGIKVKKASASIYRTWGPFAERLNRNTDRIMKNV